MAIISLVDQNVPNQQLMQDFLLLQIKNQEGIQLITF